MNNGTIIASGLTAVAKQFRLTWTNIPSGDQFFPDMYNCWSRSSIAANFTGSATVSNSFRSNSPAFGFGPQVNYSGAYANNVPAGINFLLSSSSNTGSAAPYFQVTTHYVECTVECLNASSVPVYVTIVPTIAPSLATMPFSQLFEQNGAVQTLITSGSLLPTMLKCSFNICDVIGVTKDFTLNEEIYKQNAGAVVPQIVFVHIICSAFDGTTTLNTVVKTSFKFHMRFSERNVYNSTTPTLLSSSKEEIDSVIIDKSSL